MGWDAQPAAAQSALSEGGGRSPGKGHHVQQVCLEGKQDSQDLSGTHSREPGGKASGTGRMGTGAMGSHGPRHGDAERTAPGQDREELRDRLHRKFKTY